MGANDRRMAAEDAYQLLRDRILQGQIKPGERLREASLAEELGVSRTPIREALLRLKNDSLLVHEPNRGMIVSSLDYQAVTELYLVREVLEGTAAGLAAQHASDAEIEALADLLDAQKRQANDPSEASRLNRVFHRAIYHGAHNRFIIKTLDGLSQSMSLLGRTTLSIEGRQAQALHEHRAILAEIERRDAAAAEEAARAHIRSAHRHRLRILHEDQP